MKRLVCATILALAVPAASLAQDMKGMNMKGTEQRAGKGNTIHKAVGVVKKVDAKAGKVTLAHDPVKTMNWPAMTMTFQVRTRPGSTTFVKARVSSSSSSSAGRSM